MYDPKIIIDIKDINGKIKIIIEFILYLLKGITIGLIGIEPMAPRLSSECSTTEL